MHLSINIVGDAFADVFCFLEGGMPEHGGDSRLSQPMRTVAGGSGLNTATHLSSLLRHFWTMDAADDRRTSNVTLQTVINENDEWGRLIASHCNRHQFSLMNRRVSNVPSCFVGTDEAAQFQRGEKSTGHCAVIVSGGDRSFLTHLGCIEDFGGAHILTNVDQAGNAASLQHVHVAGFYNISGFWNGALASKLADMRDTATRSKQRLTTSLVPQHDATGAWDGGLLDLLPLVDFLILSEVEAAYITKYHCVKRGDPKENLSERMAQFSRGHSSTYFIVTLGSDGAVAIREGEVVHRQTTLFQTPIDPTGAGDAFAAGFLHGYLSHTQSTAGETISKEALKAGLRWGCAVGTCSVMVQGASVPSGKTNIERMMRSIEESGSCCAKRRRTEEGQR